MTVTEKPKTILAIESAIRGGSISILSENEEIMSRRGSADVSRAEDLLVHISELLERCGIRKSDLDCIAVSNGPGSFTGIRIGLATVLGLGSSLDIPYFGVSVLAAAAAAHSAGSKVSVVLPVGRNDICRQDFQTSGEVLCPLSPPQSGHVQELSEIIKESSEVHFLIPQELYDNLKLDVNQESKIHSLDRNLAYYLGLASLNAEFKSDMNPFYIQNTRAGLGVS